MSVVSAVALARTRYPLLSPPRCKRCNANGVVLLWCCWLLLALQHFQVHGKDVHAAQQQLLPHPAAAATAAAHFGRAALPAEALHHTHLRQPVAQASHRQLSSFMASNIGRPTGQLLPYPRDAAGVNNFLQAAFVSGQAPHIIPTWFVVVTDPGNAYATNLTEAQVAAQVELLNRGFATGLPAIAGASVTESGSSQRQAAWESGRWSGSTNRLWQFKLLGVKYTSSSSPMCAGSKTEQDVKSAWRSKVVAEAGTPFDRTLVVYASDLTNAACNGAVAGYQALFGFSNTPSDLVFWKQHHMTYRDGVVLDFKYLYNSAVPADSGMPAMHGASSGAQLLHETGHWMGLRHTFDGGCTTDAASSDQVDDTPAEAHPLSWGSVDMRDASSGCHPRDSCPNIPGMDAHDNYMTYNNLACAREFTRGQQARMLFMFQVVRQG